VKRLKLLTIVGTRPEIIRMSRIVPLADQYFDHTFVHTGQNYDPLLKDVFFRDLRLRQPDVWMPSADLPAVQQVGVFLTHAEKIIAEVKPDRFLILGDTNSALTAWVAKRHGIPVFHMEAGNRCFDDRVPEEVNRRMIDQCSDVLLPYTARGRENLLREGFSPDRVYVTGNPILEVFNAYQNDIEASKILMQLNLQPKKYFLVTLHRAENVDLNERLKSFLDGFELLYEEHKCPVVVSVHPRTANRLKAIGESEEKLRARGIQMCKSFSFFDFAKLEKSAFCVLTDSGTVQEECCIFHIPNVTLRDVTERPETFDAGSNILSGADPEMISQSVRAAVQLGTEWQPPKEYQETNVSRKIIRLLQSYRI
jgi:UDP-N-acetylglucosamine 2-epimerase (non-hydrolysing)